MLCSIGSGGEGIRAYLHVGGTGTAFGHRQERVVNDGRDVLDAIDAGVPFGEGTKEAELVFGFMEEAFPLVHQVAGYLGGDIEDGDRVAVGSAHSGGGVGGAGAGGGDANAGAAARAGVAVGEVGSGLLMADGYVAELRVLGEGIVDGEGMDTDETEDNVDAVGDKGPDYCLATGDLCHLKPPIRLRYAGQGRTGSAEV